MFENLRVFGLNGLIECELTNLGQLNVICGKNNSGKSTILEIINSASQRVHGKLFTQELTDAFFSRTLAHFRFENLQKEGAYKRAVHKILLGQTWYEDKTKELITELRKSFDKDFILRGHSIPNPTIENIYVNLVTTIPSVLLIPPKRTLELHKNVQANDKIEPIGLGILNQLFLYRSSPDGTTEKKLYETIRSHFKSISSGYTFDIHMNTSTVAILNFSRGNNEWISASSCGLGLQDLLIILWFVISSNHAVLLIEEPESHMHPEMQRKLLEFLRSQTDEQFFITSHSNVFVNTAYADKVFYTKFEEGIKLSDATNRASVLSDLGYSVADNLVSDLVIFVEGPKDVPVIEEFLIKLGAFSDYAIKIWPLGGDIMDQLDISVFTENYKLIALIDKDPLSNSIRKRFIENCEEHKIPIVRTSRYSIENYFSLRALKEVFGNQIDSGVTEIQPDKKLEDQIGINVKKNNRKITQAMTLEEISGTDLEEFLYKVIEICKK